MSEAPLTTFGPLLRRLRMRAGLTQKELAVAVGYSVSMISSLERGSRLPNVETVKRRFISALGLHGEQPPAVLLVALATAAHEGTGPVPMSPSDAMPAVAGVPVPSTVPAFQPTAAPLLGREDDLALVSKQLAACRGRLLTLTGLPGVGKTRLALAVAQLAGPLYQDGACFVPLGTVMDADLVVSTVFTAVLAAYQEQGNGGLAPDKGLIQLLRGKELLLVLDNFEHVLPAAPMVAGLLSGCPLLRILVTSRERLHLRAEQRYHVPPLQSEPCVALFVHRARSVVPGLQLTLEERQTIAEICAQLDYVPLAIELSAATVDRVPLPALLEGVRRQRLGLPANAGERSEHISSAGTRTVATALQRSYELLSDVQQEILRWLAVFVGGCEPATLEAWGATLEDIQALVNKSLIHIEAGNDARRIVMLETVREYARWELDRAGEGMAVRRRHLDHYLALAEAAEPQLFGSAQATWLARLEMELYNFFAALDTALATGQIEDAARLVTALRHFWVTRSHLAEARMWLQRVRAVGERTLPPVLWVSLLNSEGSVAFYQGDFAAARACFDSALQAARAAGDSHGMAFALDGLGAEAANRMAYGEAYQHSLESLALSEAAGELWLAGITLVNLGEIARLEGDSARAIEFYERSLTYLDQVGDTFFIAVVLLNLGQSVQNLGDMARAERLYRESLALGNATGSHQVLATAVEKLAGVFAAKGELIRAAELLGAAAALRRARNLPRQPVDQEDHDRLEQALRTNLAAATLAAAWQQGEQLALADLLRAV